MPQRICLNMIVKDEAHVIARCLRSVKPFIEYWVIVDTGSTDETKAVIRQELAGIPGELHDRPWLNFGNNRSEAIHLARGKADYIFIMDADDWVEREESFKPEALAADAYRVRVCSAKHVFWRINLVSDRFEWRYDYVIHEKIACDRPFRTERLAGLTIRSTHEGSRNRDPEKCRKEAMLIEAALEKQPDEPRYLFYLGQTWRDAGELEKGLAAYRKRATLGGSQGEIWYSLYQTGRISDRLERPADEIVTAYLAAYEASPVRAEPLGWLAIHQRERGRPAAALLFARQAAALPMPDDGHFVEVGWYEWRARFEWAQAALAAGQRHEAQAALRGLVDNAAVPERHRDEVQRLAREHGITGAEAMPSQAAGSLPKPLVAPPASSFGAEQARGIAWLGALHLARTVDEKGRFDYEIDYQKGEVLPTYNIVRHCGCTWALLDVYQDIRDQRLLAAAERALRFLDRRMQVFGNTLVVLEKNVCKSGGNALAGMAYLKHYALTGSSASLETGRKLIDYLLGCIQPDGSLGFQVRRMETPFKETGKSIIYFPGEASLALAYLSALTGEIRYADGARRLVHWMETVRDHEKQEQDHWLLQAFEVLGGEHLAYASRVAWEIMSNPGYLKRDNSTPVACRSEALISFLELTGDPQVEQFIVDLLQHQTSFQLREGTWAGAFIGRRDDPVLRNDYTQHNISSFIRYWRAKNRSTSPSGALAINKPEPVDLPPATPVVMARAAANSKETGIATESTVSPDAALRTSITAATSVAVKGNDKSRPVKTEKPLWTVPEVAQATGGEWLQLPESDLGFSNFWYLSGYLSPGALMVTTNSAQWSSGHPESWHDLAALKAHGARAVIVHERPSDIPPGLGVLLVDDTFKAMNDMALQRRRQYPGKVIALTGSVGKTSTKQAIVDLLAGQGEIHSSHHLFNHRAGVPLSVAQMPVDADYAIFELGMGRPGSILPKSQLLQPDVAIVTDIQPDHTAFHNSLDSIAETKAAIFDGVPKSGAAIINRDSSYYDFFLGYAREKGITRIITFGRHGDADFCLLSCDETAQGSTISLRLMGKEIPAVFFPRAGSHQAINLTAALAAIWAAGADLDSAIAHISQLGSIAGRGQTHIIATPAGNIRLIDESFSANPTSMRTAMHLLGLQPVSPGGRRIAILGDMQELGPQSREYHAGLAGAFQEERIDLLLTIGQEIVAMRDALPKKALGAHCNTVDELIAAVKENIRGGDAVCVKGSARLEGMGRVLAAIRGMGDEFVPQVSHGTIAPNSAC